MISDFLFDSDVANSWMRDLAKAASLPVPDGDELSEAVMDDGFVANNFHISKMANLLNSQANLNSIAEMQTVTSCVMPLCSVPAMIAGSDPATHALDGQSSSVGSPVVDQAASAPNNKVAEINSSSSDEGCFVPPQVKLPKPHGGRPQGKLLHKVRSRSKSPRRKSPRPLTLLVSVLEPVVSAGVSVRVPPPRFFS